MEIYNITILRNNVNIFYDNYESEQCSVGWKRKTTFLVQKVTIFFDDEAMFQWTDGFR